VTQSLIADNTGPLPKHRSFHNLWSLNTVMQPLDSDEFVVARTQPHTSMRKARLSSSLIDTLAVGLLGWR
jgi:hypothetical protein